MRPHGRAKTDRHDPRAWAICDDCGLLYNQIDLQWQLQWAGNRLVNQNMLVCERCYDVPQEQLRTIILPADPEPIEDPRPEPYSYENNPIDTIGLNIGTMVQNAGVKAAFDSNTNKPFFLSAALWVSTAGLTNTVGKNWTGLDPNNTNGVTVNRFVATAPNNAKFIATGPVVYAFQGANIIPAWTTLSTGTTAGTVGEVIDVMVTPTTGYMFHQFALTGNGTSASIAQLQIYKT